MMEQARIYFLRAIHLATLGGYSDVEIYLRAVFSRLLQMEGDLVSATQEIQKANERMAVAATAWARDEAVSQEVRLDLALNRLAAAETALELRGVRIPVQAPLPDLGPGLTTTYSVGLLYNSALRILLYRAKDKLDVTSLRQGIELAEDLIFRVLQGEYLLTAIESLLLRAQLHITLTEHEQSLNDVAQAVKLAEPEGFLSVFVEQGSSIEEALWTLLRQNALGKSHGNSQLEYVKRILITFSTSQDPGGNVTMSGSAGQSGSTAAQTTVLIEPLSQREIEVLHLICDGYSNQEIAGRLVLSLHTVKKHISNIFRKLSVTSRTQAIARARELKLL
jgi:LuxR family maltose regulon positive regulatory protein